ncbi:uncharacterized protein LOC135494560 isoform X2 [Lineus longissimus]|uniref:uncharacterized protein LOC135494560 isoform X2 n=1 Tax=Lineus longissimus TaxID=88925 RepID=UPI00315DF0A3
MADLALYEEYLDLPIDAPANLHGFALDIGCVLAKIAILQGRGPKRTKLCLRTYPVAHLDQLLLYAKTRLPSTGPTSQNIAVALSAEEPDLVVEKIKQVIGESTKVETFVRNDCLVKGFYTLASLPESQVTYAPSGKKIVMKNMQPVAETVNHELSEKPNVKFPCLYANLGSSFTWFRVEADGSHKVIQRNPRGGLFYLSLAKLLFNCESYQQLTTLAEMGSGERLSFCFNDFPAEKFGPFEPKLMQNMMPDHPVTAFPFWKIIHNNVTDPQPEEIARILVEMGSMDVLGCAGQFYAISDYQVEQIYVSGNYMRGQTITKMALGELAPAQNFLFMKPMYQPKFLKHEGYLGAIGAMVYLLKSSVVGV